MGTEGQVKEDRTAQRVSVVSSRTDGPGRYIVVLEADDTNVLRELRAEQMAIDHAQEKFGISRPGIEVQFTINLVPSEGEEGEPARHRREVVVTAGH